MRGGLLFVLNKGIMVTKNFIAIPYPTHAKQGYGFEVLYSYPIPTSFYPYQFSLPIPRFYPNTTQVRLWRKTEADLLVYFLMRTDMRCGLLSC